MDKHYLTPLFAPQSIIVLAGDPETPDAQTPYAQALHGLLKAKRFTGTLTFVNTKMMGTLSDLAQVKAAAGRGRRCRMALRGARQRRGV